MGAMKGWEWLARGLVLSVLVGLPLSLWAADRVWNGSARWWIAQIPESGGWQPPTLEVQAGEEIRLRVTSADVVHGLSIPGLGISVTVEPGKVREIRLRPERPGRYRAICTVVCSPRHGEMIAELVVRPPGGGPIPEITAAPDGAFLFQTYCAACHGPQGEGKIGPPLNAAGRVPQMDEATLRAIIRQGRPGTAMPAWGDRLSSEEIEALIRFLRELSQEPSRP
ncbi:Cytochrome c oxidase subunit 2 [Candidatus Thermoflexus japonica]|uniref:Cytochrome aa3 subunit 2 n=1 Tax=Candidatus Thermoflexus japonica TaxID=2035417 RepID=A0A2H5Y303_9CHLR|nr:Cytochrome c oxidase subunit 2 [Candidatus Thermoflexus japonica]